MNIKDQDEKIIFEFDHIFILIVSTAVATTVVGLLIAGHYLEKTFRW